MNHDETFAMLQQWLRNDTHNLRAPGVKVNLFRLSDYVSGRSLVPDKETLTFLHAYIFALEERGYYANKQIEELKRRPLPPR